MFRRSIAHLHEESEAYSKEGTRGGGMVSAYSQHINEMISHTEMRPNLTEFTHVTHWNAPFQL